MLPLTIKALRFWDAPRIPLAPTKGPGCHWHSSHNSSDKIYWNFLFQRIPCAGLCSAQVVHLPPCRFQGSILPLALPELIFRSTRGANCRLLRCLRTLEPRPGVSSVTEEGRITRSGFNQFGPYGSYLEILHVHWQVRAQHTGAGQTDHKCKDEGTESHTKPEVKQATPSAMKNHAALYFQKRNSSL